MKIAVITDLHFGARDNSKIIDTHIRQFYEEVLFPYIDENGIEQLWCLGDTFDRRKYIGFQIFESCYQYFFKQIEERNLPSVFIVGNHDVFYRNTNEVNSPSLLLKGMKNCTIVSDNVYELTIDNLQAVFVPWINNANYSRITEQLRDTDARYCFGHFEFSGFEMYKGLISHDGMETSEFNKFEEVFSGHFHRPSSKGRITYIGNPYQLTWGDYPDQKRFMVVDTEKEEFTFIQNPNRLFYKLNVTGSDISDDFTGEKVETFDHLTGKYVRLNVVEKGNQYEFEKIVDKIQSVDPADLKIIDDVFVHLIEETEEQMQSDDTFTVIQNYIDRIEGDFDKTRLKSMLLNLYAKSQELTFE